VTQRHTVESDLLPIWRDVAERGEALPSEGALAEALGTSRPAIREALIRMEADGLVRRLHGSGTFPNPAALEIPVRMDRAADYADRLASVGFRTEVEVLGAEIVIADAIIAERLAIAPGSAVLRTTKRWRADGVVAVVAVDDIPLDRRADPAAAVAAAANAAMLLAAEFGAGRPDWICTYPTAIALDEATAGRLEMDPGQAALRLEQLAVERLGRRVFHAVEHLRPGVVEFGLIRTIA
jgi:GntR family transcriptional regulator